MLKYNLHEWEAGSEPHLALSGFKKVLRDGWRGSGLSIFGFKEKRQEKKAGRLEVVFEEVFFFLFFSFMPYITAHRHDTPPGSAAMIWDTPQWAWSF